MKLLTPIIICLSLLPGTLFGNTITVTNTSDSGPGSLRDAIAASSPGDTIDINLAYPATITLSSTLVIGISLTISGPGASSLAISGNNAVQVFLIFCGCVGPTVTVSGVTIQDGTTDSGGGILNFGGTLIVTNSVISGNSASYGGAIYSQGISVTITNSVIAANQALSSGGFGGGIFNRFGTLALTNSYVLGNAAASEGGGIFNFGAGAGPPDATQMNVTNTTISSQSGHGLRRRHRQLGSDAIADQRHDFRQLSHIRWRQHL